ncbi:hypothetical protein Bbelb_070380 [Branchiostoma belcheri]|nr:hypothetical protein Bbelb_070380 [Branchiostoma belcheri]
MEAKRKKRSWQPEFMESVLRDIKENSLKPAEAARKYNIPRTTLNDKLSGKSKVDARNGRPPILSKEEESTILKYSEYRVRAGHPVTKTAMLSMTAAIHSRHSKMIGVKSKFDPKKGPSRQWWADFKKRNGVLLRKPDPLDRGRKDAVDKATVDNFFTLYQDLLKTHGLEKAPHRVYNADETGFTLDPQRKKIVTFHSVLGTSSSVRPGTRDHVSVMECASADGTAIPPLIIFSKNFPSSPYKLEGPENALYASTPSGYMDSNVYVEWLQKCFHRYASTERPIVLLQDQHSAHVTPAAIEVALKHNIILIGFPPHSSHFIQPMDARGGPFSSLKSKFGDVVQNLNVAKPNFVVTKSSFPRIYRVVRDEGLTMAVVKRGFKNTGIFPVNADRIDEKWLVMNKQPGGAEENGTKDALLSETMEQGPTVSSQELEGRQLLSIEVEMLELAAAASFDQPSTSSQSTAPKVTCKTSTNTEASCPSCGGVATSPMLNPLVSAGIIPGYMSDLLTPIRESQARRRRKVTPKAIVFDEEKAHRR